MSNVISKEYLTIRQAAKAKGTSYAALWKWVQRNNVPVERIDRTVLVRLSDLEGYVPR